MSYRIVLIKGVNGIGKTSLVREISSKSLETGLSKDGVIYINMVGNDTMESLFSMIRYQVEKNSYNCRPADTKKTEMLNLTKIVSLLEKKEVLLILDNIDALLYEEKE